MAGPLSVPPAAPRPAAHRCAAPGCRAWACFGFGPPLWGVSRLVWLCFEHRGLAEARIEAARPRPPEVNELVSPAGNDMTSAEARKATSGAPVASERGTGPDRRDGLEGACAGARLSSRAKPVTDRQADTSRQGALL